MNPDIEPDLFPELPRRKVRKVSSREMVTPTLYAVKERYGVTWAEIHQRTRIPRRTLERWGQSDRLPTDWVALLVLEKLWSIWPESRPKIQS